MANASVAAGRTSVVEAELNLRSTRVCGLMLLAGMCAVDNHIGICLLLLFLVLVCDASSTLHEEARGLAHAIPSIRNRLVECLACSALAMVLLVLQTVLFVVGMVHFYNAEPGTIRDVKWFI